jgi:hypothetical protein
MKRSGSNVASQSDFVCCGFGHASTMKLSSPRRLTRGLISPG